MLVLLAATALMQAPKPVILRFWRERQAGIASASFHWTETQAHRRDWLPNPRHPEYEHSEDPGLAVERTDTLSRVLLISGPRMRYLFTARRRSANGRVVRTDTSASDWTQRANEVQDLWMRPVLLFARPLDRNLGLLRLDRAVTNGGLDYSWRRFEGLQVLEEAAPDTAGWRYSLWLDPARDFVVRRYLLMKGPDVIVEMDIDYFRHERWGWIPCRWVTVRRKAAGALWRSGEARLTAFRINGEAGTLPARTATGKTSCR